MTVGTITARLEGGKELSKRLKGISVMTRGKAGRSALRKAAKLIADAGAQAALALDDPLTSESIAANIIVKANSKAARSGDIEFNVGVAGGSRSRESNQGNPGGDTWYWRLLEFGFTLRDGSSYPAKEFLTKSLAANVNPATDVFVREYGRSLDRFLKRGIS